MLYISLVHTNAMQTSECHMEKCSVTLSSTQLKTKDNIPADNWHTVELHIQYHLQVLYKETPTTQRPKCLSRIWPRCHDQWHHPACLQWKCKTGQHQPSIILCKLMFTAGSVLYNEWLIIIICHADKLGQLLFPISYDCQFLRSGLCFLSILCHAAKPSRHFFLCFPHAIFPSSLPVVSMFWSTFRLVTVNNYQPR